MKTQSTCEPKWKGTITTTETISENGDFVTVRFRTKINVRAHWECDQPFIRHSYQGR